MSDAQERIITFGMLTDKEQDALRSSDDAYREQTIDLRQRLIETSLKRKSRIEELEAKLAKAVDVGNKMAHSIEGNYYLPNIAGEWRKVAAEIKGEN